ncbi:MAG: hypothetical protein AMK71_03005 [Nitrospira bacterium SG8_35_4]|nr:MAG: hypothetical protein AMK71_03005 [Nitrospira bacterium SG8_35_4]
MANKSEVQILHLEDDFALYERIASQLKVKSVYFTPSYLLSIQKAEGYPIKVVIVRDEESLALIPYVWRKINDLPFCKDISEEMFDIITPHEYSGFITNEDNPEKRIKLCSVLFAAVDDLCSNKRVVTEFARFDPFITEISLIENHYEIRYVGHNVYIYLKQTDEKIWNSFEHSAQKNIKTAERCGLQFHEADHEKEIDIFIRFYRDSMQRLGAQKYFYFNREYFIALLKSCKGARLFMVSDASGVPVAASILLYHGDTAHHHLTGYDPAALSMRPNDFMIYQLAMWAKGQGITYLHLGGGAESIRNFKKKFSPLRTPYHIGYKVHNIKYYEMLCQAWREQSRNSAKTDYFPLYRFNQ